MLLELVHEPQAVLVAGVYASSSAILPAITPLAIIAG